MPAPHLPSYACPPPAFFLFSHAFFPPPSVGLATENNTNKQLQVCISGEPRGARIQITSVIASLRPTVATLRLFFSCSRSSSFWTFWTSTLLPKPQLCRTTHLFFDPTANVCCSVTHLTTLLHNTPHHTPWSKVCLLPRAAPCFKIRPK